MLNICSECMDSKPEAGAHTESVKISKYRFASIPHRT